MLLSPFKMKSKKVDDNKGKQPKYAIRNNENKQINNNKNKMIKKNTEIYNVECTKMNIQNQTN